MAIEAPLQDVLKVSTSRSKGETPGVLGAPGSRRHRRQEERWGTLGEKELLKNTSRNLCKSLSIIMTSGRGFSHLSLLFNIPVCGALGSGGGLLQEGLLFWYHFLKNGSQNGVQILLKIKAKNGMPFWGFEVFLGGVWMAKTFNNARFLRILKV